MRTALLGTLLCVLVWTPSAFAQDGPPDFSAEDATQATAQEKSAFARDALLEMNEALALVNQYMSQAQQEGDDEIIQCVRIKQASVKALRDVSERAGRSMQEALSESNTVRADHEFRKIAVALSKVRQFMAEAEACIGQGNVTGGSTQLEVLNAQALSDNDETSSSEEAGIIGNDPPNTSPFE